jgi:hypothetical protein
MTTPSSYPTHPPPTTPKHPDNKKQISQSNIHLSDPWWICTTLSLFYTIKRGYNFGLVELATASPRFGIMLASMCLSIVFIIVDTCSVLGAFNSASLPIGVQPFWKVCMLQPPTKRNATLDY